MREDYSAGGDAWNYFTHDQARSRAYRWGEDGIAGICDERQRLCLALALWNGADPILKERMFGLTNSEGNHGEDVKEYWFYLDSTPTHSYLKCLYKYPQRAFPYDDLVATNGAPRQAGLRVRAARHRRSSTRTATSTWSSSTPRRAPDDILMLVTAHNRGPGRGDAAPAADAVVPQHVVVGRRASRSPSLDGRRRRRACAPRTPSSASGGCAPTRRRELLFCENETNNERLFGAPNASPYVKDAIDDYVVDGDAGAVNPDAHGHEGAPPTTCSRSRPGASASIRVRLTRRPAPATPLGADVRPRARRTRRDGGRRVLRDGHPADARRRRARW